MKISLMTRGFRSHRIQQIFWRDMLQALAVIVFGLSLASAAKPPKQLVTTIEHFMNMDSTSIEISQVIDWRFATENDSIKLQMDIQGGHNFHMTLAAYGMEIFVTEHEMVTINHSRQQILFEKASPDALLKQLFVGGDLNTARFQREKDLGLGARQLDFKFAGDFSDWESLTVIVDKNDNLTKINLVDYDGNKYLISLKYLPRYVGFSAPDITTEYSHYQIAGLRD